MTTGTLPLPLLGSLLFTMMGPIALLPLFASVTAGMDEQMQRRTAFKAFTAALVAITVAVFIGAGALTGAGTSQSSLIIAAGMILTITALGNIFGWTRSAGAKGAETPGDALALSPIAIPGIVTPMGVAILIIFVGHFPSMSEKFAIMTIVAGIMALNLVAMLGAHWFMRTIGPTPLIVLGAVFGVLQVAMGIEMIVSGLTRSRLLG